MSKKESSESSFPSWKDTVEEISEDISPCLL